MPRLLPPLAVILACLGVSAGAAMLATQAAPEAAGECPITAARWFTTEQVLPDGRIRASHFVLLHNPEPQARAYALHFTHAAATQRRDGARAALPGDATLPVLLGREVLPPGAAPPDAAQLAAMTRLICRG